MNMSYCRWENTFNDFLACKGDLDDRRRREADEPLSESELNAAENLLSAAMEMISDMAEDLNIPVADLIHRKGKVLEEYWEDLQTQNGNREEED